VKKCHDLGHLSFSVNRPIKLIWTNLIKDYLKMLLTKFGDQASITSEKEDVKRYFYF
jgi:hypothetical protein